MIELDYSLVCARCLRNFADSPEEMPRHVGRCKLRYTHPLLRSKRFQLYCIPPKARLAERRFTAETVVKTMQDSNEVPTDKAGWYADREDGQILQSHAFVPTVNDNVVGLAIASLKLCFPYVHGRTTEKSAIPETSPRWTITRLWVLKPHRREGIASKTILAVAKYFKVDVSELGVDTPNPHSRKVMESLCGIQINLAFAAPEP